MPTFRAALYARVSTLEQAQPDKASIPAQLQAEHTGERLLTGTR